MTGLAFGPPRSQQHLQEGRAAFCSFVINAHRPCVDTSVKTARQQRHSSDLSLCLQHRCGHMGLLGHKPTVFQVCEHLF